jgi:hypothetical protein
MMAENPVKYGVFVHESGCSEFLTKAFETIEEATHEQLQESIRGRHSQVRRYRAAPIWANVVPLTSLGHPKRQYVEGRRWLPYVSL